MLNITIEDMPVMAEALRDLALAVIVAKAVHEPLAAEMEAVDRGLLQKREYFDDDGKRITEPKRSWLIQDSQSDVYYADRQEYVSMNYPELEHGHCPALTAESAHIDAQNALLAKAAEFVPEFSKLYHLDLRRRGLELLMQIALAK